MITRSMAKRSLEPNWSEVPADLLGLIFKRLAFIDTVRFRAVCHSWNMAARSCRSPGTLWFMFPTTSCLYNEPDNTTLGFLSLRENRFYIVKKKNVFSDVPRGVHNMTYYSVQSKQGWLVISESGTNRIHLFNPVCGHHIHLPPLDSMIYRLLLSSDPCSSKDYRVVVMHLSSPQCSSRISLYKAGGDDAENTWTSTAPLEEKEKEKEYYDDIICRNDKVFGLTRSGTLHVWDFSSAPTKVPINPTKLVDVEKFRSNVRSKTIQGGEYKNFLVESLGEIFIVQQISSHVNGFSPSALEFTVSKLDYSKKKWIQIQKLPTGRAILTNINDSICVSIQDFPELKENSIYFQQTDEWFQLCFGSYNLKEKKVRDYKYGNWGLKKFYSRILLVQHSCRI